MSGQARSPDPRGDFSAFTDHQSPEYWNAKLGGEKPLIPIDIVGTDLDTTRNYIQQSGRLGGLNERQAIREMNILVSQHGSLRGKTFVVIAPGLYRRDMNIYRRSTELEMNLKTIDKSPYSAELGTVALAQIPKPAGTTRQIIIDDMRNIALNPKKDILIDAAEFFQILPDGLMQEIAYSLARPYRCYRENFRLVVVHPFRQDNGHKFWQGKEFQVVRWGDTTPYTMMQLKKPLEEALQCDVDVSNMHRAGFYHQTYRSGTFTAARK